MLCTHFLACFVTDRRRDDHALIIMRIHSVLLAILWVVAAQHSNVSNLFVTTIASSPPPLWPYGCTLRSRVCRAVLPCRCARARSNTKPNIFFQLAFYIVLLFSFIFIYFKKTCLLRASSQRQYPPLILVYAHKNSNAKKYIRTFSKYLWCVLSSSSSYIRYKLELRFSCISVYLLLFVQIWNVCVGSVDIWAPYFPYIYIDIFFHLSYWQFGDPILPHPPYMYIVYHMCANIFLRTQVQLLFLVIHMYVLCIGFSFCIWSTYLALSLQFGGCIFSSYIVCICIQ